MNKQEAIEIVRKKCLCEDKETLEALRTLIPELKESEDERMWKLIKKYAHWNISDMALKADHITREQLEYWLEKQGSQNLANSAKTCKNEQNPAWGEEDEIFFKSALWHISYSVSNGKSTDIRCDTTEWLKSLKERYTWKPSDKQMASITCAVRKMKESACYDSELVSLLNDLKKLKG